MKVAGAAMQVASDKVEAAGAAVQSASGKVDGAEGSAKAADESAEDPVVAVQVLQQWSEALNDDLLKTLEGYVHPKAVELVYLENGQAFFVAPHEEDEMLHIH